MDSDELIILGLAVGASVLAIIAGLFAESFVRRAQGPVMMASGVLLLGAIALHIAPEVVELGLPGLVAIALGLLAGGVLEIGSRSVSRARSASDDKVVARTALVALAVHSTIDGAIYAIPFAHDHGSGMAAGMGLVLHEAPEGAIALMLALQGGWTRTMSIALALIASSATTVIGWFLGAGIGAAAHEHLELLFAGSAGLLSYAGTRLILVGLRRTRLALRNAD